MQPAGLGASPWCVLEGRQSAVPVLSSLSMRLCGRLACLRTGWLDWHDLRWMGEGGRLAGELLRRQAELRPGEPANIQFTSGALRGWSCAVADLFPIDMRWAELSRSQRSLPVSSSLDWRCDAGCGGCGGCPAVQAGPHRRNRINFVALAPPGAHCAGTTGFPKAATLSHRNIVNNALFVGQGCKYIEVDRWGGQEADRSSAGRAQPGC